MRGRLLIALGAVVVVLLAAAGGVYAYDSSREDVIAEGVRAGPVDVGGMRAAEARAALDRELADPLRRPVTVRVKGETFRLSARRARLRTDVDGMVAEAVRRSRGGNAVTRTARDLTGARVDGEIRPRLSYSRRAVARLVRRVKAATDVPAVEPSVSPSAAGLSVTEGRSGRELDGSQLRARVARALSTPGARTVRARPDVTYPRLSRADLRRKYPAYITVDRSGYRLRLYRNLRLAESYTIAVGQAGLETPAGLHSIQSMAVDPDWHVPNSDWAGELAGRVIPGGRADNPLKARWMAIYDGAGIHGTNETSSLGSNASHGCIRMSIPEVKELYRRVEVGTPVYIS